MAIVIDVSIAAAWCFPDEQAAAAERVLEDLPRLGGVIPWLFWYEIRNVLIVNERRARIDRTDSARFLIRLRDLRLLHDEAHDGDAMMALARGHSLSAYDAAYLETALAPRRQPGDPGPGLGECRHRRGRLRNPLTEASVLVLGMPPVAARSASAMSWSVATTLLTRPTW